MEKRTKNYALGKIYKIVDNTNGNVYIGSTCKPRLSQRLSAHYQGYKTWLKNGKGYLTAFDIIKNGDYDIVLLELCPCTCNDELLARERFYIETIKCVNKIIPGQTSKEYLKKYREANKSAIQEYYIANKSAIQEYYIANKLKIAANQQ